MKHLPESVSFNDHIQPILSEYCYHCHGSDSGTREPKDLPLRLDVAKDALAERDGNPAVITPGKPQESELIWLIRSTDPEVGMPPPHSHKVMGEREIALLEKWIAQGAEYENHWAYEAVVRPEPVLNGWSDKPVDGFIFEKLAEAGLEPNPAEDVRRFHRRLSLDLHATILYALGIDDTRLTYKFQGLDQRFTGVEPAKVIKDWFA